MVIFLPGIGHLNLFIFCHFFSLRFSIWFSFSFRLAFSSWFCFFWFDLQYGFHFFSVWFPISFFLQFHLITNINAKKRKSKTESKKTKTIYKKRKENLLQFIRISSGQKLRKISSQEWGPKDPRVSEAQSKQ